MNYYGDHIDTIYKMLATDLHIAGKEVVARDLKTKELTNVQFELTNPRNRFVSNVGRAMDMRYCIGEMCFFLSGSTDLDFISHYSKFWLKISDDGETVNSAYGHRLFGLFEVGSACLLTSSFEYVITTLALDTSSRKAVMPIYNTKDSKPSLDNPCTMFLQFLIRDNKLDCYCFMRSNDIWLGLPYDVAFFTLVHEIVYTALVDILRNDLQLGSYFHHATSLHVYERDYAGLEKVTHSDAAPLVCPLLTSKDIKLWFGNLLEHEFIKRLGLNSKPGYTETSFQNFCKSFL